MVNVAVASRSEAQSAKTQPHRSRLRRAFPTIPDILQSRRVRKLYEEAYFSARDIDFLRQVVDKGHGNKKVALFLIDLLDKHSDPSEALLAKGIRTQFVKLYETLSQRDQAKVFKQLAGKFATVDYLCSQISVRGNSDDVNLVLSVATASAGNARVAVQVLQIVKKMTTYNVRNLIRLADTNPTELDAIEHIQAKRDAEIIKGTRESKQDDKITDDEIAITRRELKEKAEQANARAREIQASLTSFTNQFSFRLTQIFIGIFASEGLSQKEIYSLFGRVIKEFLASTRPDRVQEVYASRLGRALEYVGNHCGIVYAQMLDDLDGTLQPLYRRQEEVIENRFDRYKDRTILRLVCARVSWSFDKPMVDMPVDEIQDIPATKKFKQVNVKRKTIEFFDTLFKNDATASFAIEAMLSVPIGRQHLDELALTSGDRLIQIMSKMNEEQIKETLVGWVFPIGRTEQAEPQAYNPNQATRAVLAFNIIQARPVSNELKNAALSQISNQREDVFSAAIDACFAHRMTAVIPRVYQVVSHDHRLEWKRKYVGYLVFFARTENEEAKARVKDVLKGQDKVAIVAATDYCKDYALTFAIPELSNLALAGRRSKPLITRAERTLISFVKLGIDEANVPVRKVINGLQRTALIGRTDDQRQVALNRLIEYSDGGLSFAEQSVLSIYRTLERQSERGQHWKAKRKRNGVPDKLQEAVARIYSRRNGRPNEVSPNQSPFQPTTASAQIGIVVIGGTPFMGILTRTGGKGSEILGG